MRLPYVLSALCTVGLLVGTFGCGDTPEATTSSDPGGLKTREAAELAELDADGAVPGLDGGRVEISPPRGWHRAKRKDDEWLIRFNEVPGDTYPRIMVNVEEYDDTLNVTDENVAEFAEQISAAMKSDPQAFKLSREIELIEIGDFRGITYQRRARVTYDYTKIVVERVFLVTVVDSRKYTVELRAREETSQRYEPHLHAVAAGLVFTKRDQPDPPDEKTGTEDEAKTDETKTDEAKTDDGGENPTEDESG